MTTMVYKRPIVVRGDTKGMYVLWRKVVDRGVDRSTMRVRNPSESGIPKYYTTHIGQDEDVMATTLERYSQ